MRPGSYVLEHQAVEERLVAVLQGGQEVTAIVAPGVRVLALC